MANTRSTDVVLKKSTGSFHYSVLWIYGILTTVTLLAFYPNFFNDFQWEWDDQLMIYKLWGFEISWNNILHEFTHFENGIYYPVYFLYHLILYKMFGISAAAFHISSVVLHIINTFLVWMIVKSITGIITPTVSEHGKRIFSFLVALLFAIHPVQTETVSWISASRILLYSTFFLVALLCYFRYKKYNNLWYLFAAFIGYLLGLMTKEQAIVLPVVLVLIDLVLYRKERMLFDRKVILEKVPFFIVALLFWYWSGQNGLGRLELSDGYPLHQRIALGGYSLLTYIIRFLLPVNLKYFYAYPILPGEGLPIYYYGYPILALFTLFYIIDLYRSGQYLSFFGLSFFVIGLFLVLHIIPMPRNMVSADRFLYISIVGISIWLISGLHRISTWLMSCGRTNWYRSIFGLLGIYIMCCIAYTNFLSRKWKNTETIKYEAQEYLEYIEKDQQ